MKNNLPVRLTSFTDVFVGMQIHVKTDYITDSASSNVMAGKYEVVDREPHDYDGVFTVILKGIDFWVDFNDLCEEVVVWKI